MKKINALLKTLRPKKSNDVLKRIFSGLLAIAVVVSTLGLSSFFSVSAEDIPNYPLLRYFEEGSAPSSDIPWKFGIKDFGEKPAFTESTDGYDAPVAVWNANDSKADITWTAYTGAAGYTLNIYEGTTLFYTANVNGTEWTSGVNGIIVGGNTYEIQVLALDGSNGVIAATAVRTFTAKAEEKNVISTIHDFSASDSENDVSYSRFASKEVDSDGRLIIGTSTSQTYAHLYVDGDIMCDNAEAVTFFVKADHMVSAYRIGFGANKNSFVADTSGASDKVYFVSAKNPNNYITTTLSTNKTNISNTAFGDYIGGYYVIIPLSLYSEAIRDGIKNGTYSYIDLLLESVRYKYNENDGYVKANGNSANFDGSDMVFDDFQFVSDIELFVEDLQNEYNRVNDPDKYEQALKAKNASTVTVFKKGSSTVLYADKFAGDSLTNDTAKTGYSFTDNANSRQVVFTATSESSIDYGAHLQFIAPKDGIYDLAGILKVTGNETVVDATVNYRIVKTASDSTESVVWPVSGDWASGNISAEVLNPVLDFPAPQVTLKKDESLSIEAFVHSNDSTSATVKLSFGNPTTTAVEQVTDYKGNSTTYYFGNYTARAVYDGGFSEKKYQSQSSRWDSVLLLNRDGVVSYSDFTTVNSGWQMIYSAGLKSASGSNAEQMGYYYYIPKKNELQMMLQLGYDGYGTALRFTSPTSGNATVSIPLLGYSGSTLKYRVTKNGGTVYPADSDWATPPTSNTTVTAACSVDAGDIIAIEFYSNSSAKESYKINTAPSVTVSNGSNSNALSDTTFSPLWERPYSGRDYKGEFTAPDGAVWDFGLYNVSGKSVEKADSYDTDKKYLYKKDVSDVGFVFEQEQLKFKASDNYGLSITYTAPTRGYYDFSTALDILSSNGKLNARITVGSKTVWPESGDWYSTENADGTFNAIEFGADTGDKIVFQAYVVSAEDSTEPVVIGLGTPIMQRLSNRVFTETGNSTIYRPIDYVAFEDGYKGDFIQLDSRFVYNINGTAVSLSDTNGRKLSVDDNNAFAFDNGVMTAKLGGGSTAQVIFTSPISGNGTVQIGTTLNFGAAEYRLSRNDEILFDWTDTPPETTDISAKIGDKFILEIRTSNSTEITVNAFNISLIGQHNNANSATDDGFYAVHANPYGDDYYVGKYKKTDVGFWNFNFYNSKKQEVVNADYYSADDNKKLYYSKVDNLGYHFGLNNLTAEINAKEGYGLALGFTFPRSDTFNSRMGLRLVGTSGEAELAIRMRHISASDGSSKQIWPADGTWYKQKVLGDKDIRIPYAEISLEKGDTVYVEIYATESNADTITVNLVSPAYLKEKVADIQTMDIVAKVYRALDYSPYSYIDGYYGNYIPMDNRWNFKFANVSDDGNTFDIFEANKVRTDTNNDHIYYSPNGNWPRFLWNMGSGSISATSFLSADKNCGTVMEYMVPSTNKLIITAPVNISELPFENVSLKYSIVLKKALDASETVVWPNNGEDKWEELNNDKKTSECMDIEVNAEVGDTLIFKAFWDVDPDSFGQYLAANSITTWNPSYGISPVVTIAEYIDDIKTSFSTTSQFIGTYLVNPYWRVEYSVDSNNPTWLPATVYKWGNWMAPSYNDIGINSKSWYWIRNYNGSLDNLQPSLAWKFTPQNDGYLTLSNKKASILGNSTGDNDVEFRITQNGKNVYPTEGWIAVSRDTQGTFSDIVFEVKAKDKIRFEMRTANPMVSGDQVYFEWVPTFTVSKYKNIYSSTKDIYNMLDEESLAMFKAMSGSTEFDEDLASNKVLSEKIKAEMEKLAQNDENAGTKLPQQSIIPDSSPDDYTEWTEEIITPGGRWRKIIRKYTTAWWVYALIVAACVLAVATVVFILIILRKKGKIGKKRAKIE